MNTDITENDEYHLLQPDYYTLLWFEDGELTAAVLQDDYTAWYDLAAGIAGSNLADANARTTKEEFETLIREWYLTNETAALYYDVIETNDVKAAIRAYPEFLAQGFKYISIQDKHTTSLAAIREQARLHYTRETGDTSA
jgi:hypothetical protein